MNKVAVLTILCILIGTYMACVNAGTGGRGRSYSASSRVNNNPYRPGGGYGYYGSQNAEPTPPAKSQTAKEFLDEKSGFSTFGIIAIIFCIILACLLFYYGILCYPFLCRDEKKYRFMDVSSTITAATSRSMQSIENYPVDKLEKSCV